jgi:hypothetical protein
MRFAVGNQAVENFGHGGRITALSRGGAQGPQEPELNLVLAIGALIRNGIELADVRHLKPLEMASGNLLLYNTRAPGGDGPQA